MVTVTVRDVPEATREALTQAARERGQSLQAYLLATLELQASFRHNARIVAAVEQRLAQGGGAGPDAPDAAEIVRQARPERRPT